MRPSAVLRSDANRPLGKHNIYLNKDEWGNLGAAIQERGIITYSLSSNRQRLFAGAGHAAVFNTWRRTRAQVLYWLPPLLLAAGAMDWANKRNEFLNSKEGRALHGHE